MNVRFASFLPSASLLAIVALVSGCGSETTGDGGGGAGPADGGASGTGGGASGGSSGEGEALIERLSACPVVSLTSDPSASECLVGSYTGETLGGDACTLTLGENGAYEFTSPALSHDRTPLDDTIFVYDYTRVQETNLIGWSVDDPLSADTFYELDFRARFGSQVPASDRKIEIQLKQTTADTMSSVACIIEL